MPRAAFAACFNHEGPRIRAVRATPNQLLCRLARTFHHKDAKAPRLKDDELGTCMVRVLVLRFVNTATYVVE
jgi:hypothetical protein